MREEFAAAISKNGEGLVDVSNKLFESNSKLVHDGDIQSQIGAIKIALLSTNAALSDLLTMHGKLVQALLQRELEQEVLDGLDFENGENAS